MDPFDGSSIKLLNVAKYVTFPRTYARLFGLGLEVREDYITDLVKLFEDSKQGALCLELVINQIRLTREIPDLEMYLNRGATKAIEEQKFYLVVCLMEHGASPMRSDLRQCVDKGLKLQDHPYIQKYLSEEVDYSSIDGLDSNAVGAKDNLYTHSNKKMKKS